MRRCLCFARPLERYSPTWSQVIRRFCRQARTALSREGCGQRLGDSFQTAQKKKKKWKSKCFFSPPDKSFCLFLSFVQVALSRVMPLKCQLSVWACIALDIKYSSPHTKTAVSGGGIQKEIKYGARTSFFPGGPVHLLFVRVTDVFQMTVSHVCWTSTKAVPWETARRYTPSDGGNLHGLTPCREVLAPEEEVVRVARWGDRNTLPSNGKPRTRTDLANSSTCCTAWKSTVGLAYQNWICRVLWSCFCGCNKYYLQQQT